MARRRHNHNRLSEPGMGGGVSAIRTDKTMGKPEGEEGKLPAPAVKQLGLPGVRSVGEVPDREGKPSAPDTTRPVPPITAGQEGRVVSAIGEAVKAADSGGKPEDPLPSREELEAMTVKGLRFLAAERGVDVRAARLKAELVTLLLAGAR